MTKKVNVRMRIDGAAQEIPAQLGRTPKRKEKAEDPRYELCGLALTEIDGEPTPILLRLFNSLGAYADTASERSRQGKSFPGFAMILGVGYGCGNSRDETYGDGDVGRVDIPVRTFDNKSITIHITVRHVRILIAGKRIVLGETLGAAIMPPDAPALKDGEPDFDGIIRAMAALSSDLKIHANDAWVVTEVEFSNQIGSMGSLSLADHAKEMAKQYERDVSHG